MTNRIVVPKKHRSKFYVLCLQDKNGGLVRLVHHKDYSNLLLEGMDLMKELEAPYWTIIDNYGKYVDGNFSQKENKKCRLILDVETETEKTKI